MYINILKEQGKSGDKEAELRQGALKILINSIYGFYGTGGYVFNDMEAAELVTAYGRAIIRHMINVIEQNDGVVIEVDTDGIIFSASDQVGIFQKVQDSLPSGFKIDLEFQDCSVFCKAIKNYIIFYPDGSVKCKGEFRKRNIAKYQKEFPTVYLKKLLQSRQEAEDYYFSLKSDIQSGIVDPDYLSVTKRVGKAEKQFSHLGVQAGDRITYFQGYSDERTKKGKLKIKKGIQAYAPVMSGDYHKEYYLKDLQGLRKDIDNIVS